MFSDYDGNVSSLSELGTNDLSFEINPNFLNELMMSSSPTSNNIGQDSSTATGGMEVDQDVAGWLDSLLPNQSPQESQNHSNGAHDSGIGEMNGNNEVLMCSTSTNSGNLMSDSGRNAVNNNMQQGHQLTNNLFGLLEPQHDSFLDDSDMIMSTLQSPVSVQHKF